MVIKQIEDKKISQFQATESEWMAIWNSIQIVLKIDERKTVSNFDKKILKKLKEKMWCERNFKWL